MPILPAMTALACGLPPPLTEESVAAYRCDGFLKIPGVLTRDEAEHWRQRYLALSQDEAERANANCPKPIFTQMVNLWERHPELLGLTLHPRLRGLGRALAGVPLRPWHDHLLQKEANTGTPTAWHQDQPYWPHRVDHPEGAHCPSFWVALVDVPEERGCMSFIPGSHRHRDLLAQDIGDRRDLFGKCPELEWAPKVTLPLRAGDCTVHHGRCAHMASGNRTDQARVALSIIYMDADTRCNGRGHCVINDLGLKDGDLIRAERFPEI